MQNSCFNEYFRYYLNVYYAVDVKNALLIVFKQINENALKLTYNQLSKMPFIIYVASFAGLICMWYGFFLFQISLDSKISIAPGAIFNSGISKVRVICENFT
jgi:hypothetical protein